MYISTPERRLTSNIDHSRERGVAVNEAGGSGQPSSSLTLAAIPGETLEASRIFNERLLRIVIVLAEERHFGRAAARLHMSQPALSGGLKALELEVGAQLFVRNQRRVGLTQTGQVFLKEARRLMDQSAVALALVRRSAICGLD
jgi:hypothetical protein